MKALMDAWLWLYETAKLYKANPCDVGCFGWLAPLGWALSKMAVECPCCSGTRVIVLAVAVAVAPDPIGRWLAAAVIAIFLAITAYAYIKRPLVNKEERDAEVH